MRDRPRLLAVLAALIVAAIVAVVALPRGSAPDDSQSARASAPPAASPAALTQAERNRRAQVVEPVAGETGADTAAPAGGASDGAGASDAGSAPTQSATSSGKSDKIPVYHPSAAGDAAVSDAEVLKNGIALPPLEAPEEVRNIVRAGNQIARTPYLWGGGHGKWLDKGYDCSGSISYALASAGFLNSPLDSGRLMSWGAPGKGKWITIYANTTHVFMFVAGVRFDTSGTRADGSRWQQTLRPTGGFVARHPAGF